MQTSNLFKKCFYSSLMLIVMTMPLFANGTWDGGGDGTTWSDPFNWGDNNVPTVNDDVNIPLGATVQITTTTATCRSLTIASGGTLTIEVDAELLVDGAFTAQDGLTNGGVLSIEKNAQVHIVDIDGDAYVNGVSSSLTLKADALLDIGESSTFIANYGINNRGTVNNSGTILIDNVGSTGIVNFTIGFAFPVINNSGYIGIAKEEGVSGSGVWNGGDFNNLVGGVLEIDDTGGNGIANSNQFLIATFDNEGTVEVGGYGEGNLIWALGISNSDNFTNAVGATLHIRHTLSNGIQHFSGIFTNSGTLTVDVVGAEGIVNEATFSNSDGTISINGTGSMLGPRPEGKGDMLKMGAVGSALVNRSGSTFTNTGDIHIGNEAPIPAVAIGNSSGATFYNGAFYFPGGVNTGAINIHDGNIRGVGNSGAFYNRYGSIVVENASGSGIYNSKTFSNYSTASIHIAACSDGISNVQNIDGDAEFVNGGTMYIESITGIFSHSMESEALFTNASTGEIYIDNAQRGVQVEEGTFTNSGILKIGTIGTYVHTSLQVLNGSDPANFINEGQVTIDKAQYISVEVEGLFSNMPCASFQMTGVLEISGTGIWQNDGYFSLRGDVTHEVLNTVVNTGILEDVYGSLVPFASMLDNQGQWLRPADGSNTTVNNVITTGALTPYTISSEWYDNPELSSTAAGAYNAGINAFFPNMFILPEGTSRLYFEATDMTNGCTDTLSILVSINSVTTQIKVWLEGADDPAFAPYMSTHLNTGGWIPLTQPYNQPPWDYIGTESVMTIPSEAVDWVLVEARDAANSHSILAQKAGFLLHDGSIVDINGESVGINLEGLTSADAYYLVVRHRNHLAAMSAVPVQTPNGSSYNFTSDSSQAYGISQMKNLACGWAGLYAGDFNGDGVITVADFNTYQPAASLINVYHNADANLDDSVTVADFNLYQPNASIIGIEQIRY